MKPLVLLALLFGTATLTISYSTPAQAGILEFFFPSMAKKEPDLNDTLRAPFADPVPEDQKGVRPDPKRTLSENAIPMHLPHRQPAQIMEIASHMVSEALVFQGQNYEDDLFDIHTKFNEEGKAAYDKFLEDSKIKKVLETRKFYVRSFVSEDPVLLNYGAVNKRYKWLLDVPVMVSYMRRGSNDYKKSDALTNQKMTIRLQLGRDENAPYENGVFIERWTAKIHSVEKSE